MKKQRGRKAVHRSLPSLSAACGDFRRLGKSENCAERLFEILSPIIHRCRRTVPQPFYAMRDVAKFFDVSLTTVAKVYRHLGREGMLTLIRSSQSTIPPRTPRPRLAVRGVVCMPIWMPGFLRYRDWRTGFSDLEEELARRRFILQPLFYKQGEDFAPNFLDRILNSNPDHVLWIGSILVDHMIMRRIVDAGVSLVLILTNREPENFPARIYRLSNEQAFRQGLKEWATSGEIDDIVVPLYGEEKASFVRNIKLLESCGLPYHIARWHQNKLSLSEYMRYLAPKRRTGIIFDDDIFFTQLCALMPREMFKLFSRHRVMVMRQATIHSLAMAADLTVDAILPGKQLARKIALDLSRGEGILTGGAGVFEAEWRPRVPLGEIVQCEFNE